MRKSFTPAANSGLSPAQKFAVFSVSCLAVSVNLGVALVSLSKLLVLLSVIWVAWTRRRKPSQLAPHEWPTDTGKPSTRVPLSIWCVMLALGWMAASSLWSEAPTELVWPTWMRHARWWVLMAVWYLLETSQQAWTVLRWLLAGHVFLVISSWLMWLGFALPWAVGISGSDISLGIPFASRLEQPIFYTLGLTMLWYWRDQLSPRSRPWVLWGIGALTLLNFAVVMTGRSGLVSLFLALMTGLLLGLPRRWRLGAVMLPLLAALMLYAASPRVHEAVNKAYSEVVQYQQHGDITTSQGQRLEFWHHSLEAIQDAPLIGHGVGSWNKVYLERGGAYPDVSNPHQQFLLWWVEAGLVGLLALLSVIAAMWRDAWQLPRFAGQALWVVVAVSLGISMMNCPFFGAGLGEYLLMLMGLLLSLGKTSVGTQSPDAAQPTRPA